MRTAISTSTLTIATKRMAETYWSVSFYKKDDRRHAFGWFQSHKPTDKQIESDRVWYNVPEETWDVVISETDVEIDEVE